MNEIERIKLEARKYGELNTQRLSLSFSISISFSEVHLFIWRMGWVIVVS